MSSTITARSVPVEIEGIRKEFPQHLALDSVDLSIPAGSFTTLLGPSGCGKTTLLRILAGFETPTTGTVSIGGRDVSRVQPWKRDVGFVFQNYALWPTMTIAQTVAYGLKLRKLPRTEVTERVQAALRMVGLEGRADAYPGQLSGGQQQRVSIARALALRPTVLLMDEPLSNLDAKMRVDMRQELLEIQRSVGITAVYVTHDQEEALEMSDQIAVLHDGRVDQLGTPEQIYERPQTAFVADFVGQVTLVDGTLRGAAFSPALADSRAVDLDPAGAPEGASLLAVRPEHLRVVSEGEGHLTGTYERTSYQGRARTSFFRLSDGAQALVAHRAPLDLEVGVRCGLDVVHAVAVPGA